MTDTRLSIAKADIVKLFDDLPVKVLKKPDFERFLLENRRFWRLTKSATTDDFIDFLLLKAKLKKVKLEFPYRALISYIWGDASIYELALSAKPDSYFTHYTAMYIHELTEQVPNTIYVNYEQRRKGRKETRLLQDSIDKAFHRQARVSKNITFYKDKRICLLNGMYTGKLGVEEIEGTEGERIHVTNVERTLIDVTVRPMYSGGVFEVLKAYRLAKEKVSINKLVSFLKKLNYVYPYHQAVGFYLERAGVYRDSLVNLLLNMDMKYDFYLDHQMKETSYSKKWRLFFPKGL